MRVLARLGSIRTEVATVPQAETAVVLAVQVTPVREPDGPRTGPDTVVFGLAGQDGTFTELAALDGRYLSTEVAGGFTGRVIGAYAATGTVHIDWFDYQPLREPQ